MGGVPAARPTKRWLVIAAVCWALALGVAGYLNARSGRPTAREQTTLAQARETVDRALAQVATAAGPDTVAALSAYALTPGCRITVARDGVDLARVISLHTPAGREPALLDRLVDALPESYHGQVFRAVRPSVAPRFRADAGDFVALRAEVTGPGEVRLEAKAGCRPGGDLGAPALGPDPAPADRAPIEAVLRSIGETDARWRTYQAVCPAGGSLRTVEAVSPQTSTPAPTSSAPSPPARSSVSPPAGPSARPPGGSSVSPRAGSSVGPPGGPLVGPSASRPDRPPLPEALRRVGGVTAVILSQPQRYAYRAGPVGVAVTVQDGTLTVTATTGCP